MNRVLLILALVCAVIATILGFDVLNADSDPHVLGWLSAAVALWIGSALA